MIHLSWNDIEQDCIKLAEQIHSSDHKAVLGVARGGVVPALLVAKQLKISCFDVIGVSSYEGQVQKNTIHIIKPVSGFVSELCPDGKGLLVIDDLADTGRTMTAMRGLFPQATFCVPYTKPAGKNDVDIYVREYSQQDWLIFPWEKHE